ncbi:transcription initiation factor TFIID subunit 3 [Phlebotomus argentipes]|uniref:transcription initiation factor TFIID subunit 3 n=1 Tax=Phlebotomus argentipes TaxID=94469 RepID=UPI002892E895|nr:transcription initiation factor TFIID subunit 3 [Phlebotomus argentipes]
MSEAYSHQVLRTVVAQICQTIGWHSIQSGTLDILVDTAKRYIQALGHETHRYTELAQRTEPNLDDLAEALDSWRVSYSDILEFVRNVSPEECAVKVPKYPARKENHLNFLKPGSKEVITRPVHIPEYLPPMLPEEEDEAKQAEKENARRDGEIDVVSLSPRQTSQTKTQPEFVAPQGVPRPRFSNQAQEDDMGRAVRENSSVIMTTSGFISPSRAGKLPDAKLSVDLAELLHQLVGPELPPPPPKVFPSVVPSKDGDPAPLLTAPSPLNIASANPEKFDVKVKGRKGAERKPPGETRPRQRSAKAHAHKAKDGPPAKRQHAGKKAAQQPPLPPPDVPLPMDLATVKRPPEEAPEAPFVEGKISAEPDKLKMNIFKRISSTKVTGVKEEKPQIVDLTLQDASPEPEPHTSVRVIPQTPLSPPPPTTKKKLNAGRTAEPKERKKPKTERASKKQKMSMSQPMMDNPMRFDFNFPGQSGADFQHAPLEQKNPISMFPQQPPRPTGPHNLFNLFNFSSSPGLIPPPSLFGNPFGLQQQPGGLHFPPGGIRGPNPFTLMPLPRFPPITTAIPAGAPSSPAPLSPQVVPDKSQCNVAPLVPESLKLEPLILNMSAGASSPGVEPKVEPAAAAAEEDEEEAKRRKLEKKVKKKKEKKEKTRDKEKKREEKRALKDAKAKERREKKREREREGFMEQQQQQEGMTVGIPKLTLKLGHSPKSMSPDGGRKLMIKPIKRESAMSGETEGGGGEMPELAKISPLVTRPPKPKSPTFGHGFFQHSPTGSSLPPTPGISSSAKGFGASLASPTDAMKSPTSSLTPMPARGRPKGSGSKQHGAGLSVAPATPGLISGLNLPMETSLIPEKMINNSMRDADGNQVWICPACGRVDDGTPMIGCDGCDAWYHWVCVGIQVPPDATEDWYCRVCILKKQEIQAGGGSGSERKKKRKRRDKKQQV